MRIFPFALRIELLFFYIRRGCRISFLEFQESNSMTRISSIIAVTLTTQSLTIDIFLSNRPDNLSFYPIKIQNLTLSLFSFGIDR